MSEALTGCVVDGCEAQRLPSKARCDEHEHWHQFARSCWDCGAVRPEHITGEVWRCAECAADDFAKPTNPEPEERP